MNHEKLTHLDLFSGIGGGALATSAVWQEIEHEFVEIDPFCQAILKKHFPTSQIYGDIKEFHPTTKPFILTGGFPCQPFSSAGNKKGKQDDRDLWPEMLRVIKESKPTWIIGENVANFINMELSRSVTDLEAEGYEVQCFIIPACAVDAPHQRNRVWIIAYSSNVGDIRRPEEISKTKQGSKRIGIPELKNPTDLFDASHTASHDGKGGINKSKHILFTTGTNAFSGAWKTRQALLPSAVLCRTDDGIPNRMDRTKGLGNAWVPQVAIEIMKGIKAISK